MKETVSVDNFVWTIAYSGRIPPVCNVNAFSRDLRRTGLTEEEVDGTNSLVFIFEKSNDLRRQLEQVLERIAVNPKLYGSVKAKAGDEIIDYKSAE